MTGAGKIDDDARRFRWAVENSPSPGGGPLETVTECFHCRQSLADSRFGVILRTMDGERQLPLCQQCQGLRQAGQLPVELILQQWYYGRAQQVPESGLFAGHQVKLTCLGCDTALAATPASPTGTGTPLPRDSRRLPDGSLVVVCANCEKSNVLESRAGQLVAVRLW